MDWDLDVFNKFKKLSTVEKFEQAISAGEILELFNPLNIHHLTMNEHMSVIQAALMVPVLLRNCMIWRTWKTKINDVKIGEVISEKHVNSVILSFNEAEQ